VIILDRDIKQDIGPVGNGNMLLKEMFSPIGAPKDEAGDIDWIDDLKFYIDNDRDVLTKNLFPAVRKHQEYRNHPKAYKIYIRPVQKCVKSYCDKFQIDEPEKKFPKGSLIALAKRIAEEQNKHIARGDYEN